MGTNEPPAAPHPATIRWNSEWCTSTVCAVARAVIENHYGLPMLADALEEAGCSCPILLHWLREALDWRWGYGPLIMDRILGGRFIAPGETKTVPMPDSNVMQF